MTCQSEPDSTSPSDRWELELYTAGSSPTSRKAEAALRNLCDRFIPGRYKIKVIDLLAVPPTEALDILAVPTVVRIWPQPERRVIGDLSQTRKAAEGLGLPYANAP